MDVNWTIVIGCISILIAYIGYDRLKKKDSSDDGKTNGALMSDIGYIKSGIDDLKRKQEAAEDRHYILQERVVKIEESTKQAHKRIDELKGVVL